jgi:hypothetical protein
MEQRLSGKVKGGVVVLDDAAITDGATVTVLVNSADVIEPWGPPVDLDKNGDVIMTPELQADLDASIAESDRGEGIPWEVVRAELFGKR